MSNTSLRPSLTPSEPTRQLLRALAEVDRLSDPYLHLAHSDIPQGGWGCECVNGALCHCDDGGCECKEET